MAEKLISLRVTDDMLGLIDELRRKEPDLPTRSEMLRRLIERAAVENELKSG